MTQTIQKELTTTESPILECASIIKPGLEWIGLINKNGRLVNSVSTNSHKVPPKDQQEMWLMSIALINSMQKDFDEEYGPLNYFMTQRRDLKFIAIPANDCNTFLAVTKNNVEHEDVVRGIEQILQCSGYFLGYAIARENPIEYV